MKVRIESFFDGWVEFSSASGNGQAKWRGIPPDFNREYDVELELAPPIEVTKAIAQVPLLDADRERCLLRGEVVGGVLCVGEARFQLKGTLTGWVAVRSQALIFSASGL